MKSSYTCKLKNCKCYWNGRLFLGSVVYIQSLVEVKLLKNDFKFCVDLNCFSTFSDNKKNQLYDFVMFSCFNTTWNNNSHYMPLYFYTKLCNLLLSFKICIRSLLIILVQNYQFSIDSSFFHTTYHVSYFTTECLIFR